MGCSMSSQRKISQIDVFPKTLGGIVKEFNVGNAKFKEFNVSDVISYEFNVGNVKFKEFNVIM